VVEKLANLGLRALVDAPGLPVVRGVLRQIGCIA